VKAPGDVVKVSQTVEVMVLAVDLERNRISLSMKKNPGAKTDPAPRNDAGTRKDRPSKPAARPEGKRGKEAPKPFNNPFANAFQREKT